MKSPWVYMMANENHGTLYVGVSSDLPLRVCQHKAKTYPGFTARQGLDLLVWYAFQETMANAIRREKHIKQFPAPGKYGLSRP